MRCVAHRRGPFRSRSSSMRRPAAIRSSRSDSCPRSPTKAWSRSIRPRATWSWDLDRIRAKGYTENVVELMVGKLGQLACGNASRAAATRLSRKCRQDRDAFDRSGNFGGPCPRGPLGGRPARPGRAARRFLQVHPRPGAGSRLFIHSRWPACRSSSADRAVDSGADASGEAGRVDLRNRQSAQPMSRLDHVSR